MAKAKTAITTITFDYALVDSDEAGKLRYLSQEIRKTKQSITEYVIATGESLLAAQSLLEKHGESCFKEWVQAECGFSVRTAYNYLSAFEHFGTCANFARIEPSAMYALTKNNRAKKTALKMLDQGKVVTHTIAKTLVKEAKDSDPAVAPGKKKKSADGTAKTQAEQAKMNKSLCRELIGKLVRAIDDYHDVNPNPQRRKDIVGLIEQASANLW